jgi:hypothetical protein
MPRIERSPNALHRRALLAGLGASGLASLGAPLLSEAQGASPKRLLVVHRPCGSRPERWFPAGPAGKSWGITPLLSSFEAVRDNIVVMKGIDMPRGDWSGDEHAGGMVAMLGPTPALSKGGWTPLPGRQRSADGAFFSSEAASFDQELQKSLPALQGTPFPSLQLGTSLESMSGQGPEARLVISYAGFQQPLWPESRPAVVFDNVFGSVVVGEPGDSGAAERARLRGQSILDFVTADLTEMRGRLPASQLPKLESHLEAIRALEQQVQGGATPLGCTKPTLEALPTGNNARYLQACDQQMTLIRTAFQCDLTRVITLTFGQGNSGLDCGIFPTVTNTNYRGEGHHEVSHGDTANDRIVQEEVDRFYGDTMGKLLLELSRIPEGSGTLLDNTLVMYVTEVAYGNAHDIDSIPVLLAGGRSLGLNGGSYLTFTNRTMTDVWAEIFRAFGLPRTTLGEPDWNRGPLPGLFG